MTPGRTAAIAGCIFIAGLSGCAFFAALILMPVFDAVMGDVAIACLLLFASSLAGIFVLVPKRESNPPYTVCMCGDIHWERDGNGELVCYSCGKSMKRKS